MRVIDERGGDNPPMSWSVVRTEPDRRASERVKPAGSYSVKGLHITVSWNKSFNTTQSTLSHTTISNNSPVHLIA